MQKIIRIYFGELRLGFELYISKIARLQQKNTPIWSYVVLNSWILLLSFNQKYA